MQKLTRRMKRFKGLTVGLDLHKKFIQYSVLDTRGNEVEGSRVEAQRGALLDLVRRLHKRGKVQVSLEACGTFYWVFDALVEAVGRERVHTAHPSGMQAATRSGEKSDATDAWWLAYLLWDGRLPQARPAEGPLRELRIVGREFHWHKQVRSDLFRRLRSHAAQAGLKLPAQWHTSKVKRGQVRDILRQVPGARGRAMKGLYREALKLGQIVAHWRQKLAELCGAFEVVQLIQKEVPGLKATTAGLAFSELGDPRSFRAAKSYANATGLTPKNQGSGGKQEHGGITRAGSPLARWAYTTAVVACRRCKHGPGVCIKEWVAHRCQFKPKKKVIVAAGRKLAEGVWRLCALGEAFDLQRAFPAPRRKVS